jgi:sulfur-oxidizing protein SoxY
MIVRRPLLVAALGLPAIARAQGIEGPDGPRRAERWRDLREAILGGRATEPANELMELTAPSRALDAAAVPVSLALADALVPQVRAVWVVVDENPVPLAATFRAGPAGDLRVLSMRLRVDSYTNLHAVAETADGRLLEAVRFVKAAGGCSAPVTGDLQAARSRMGRMRLQAPDGPPSPDRPVPVQVALSHPNTSGLQMDQLTRLSIPAEYIHALRISYRSAEVLLVEAGISVAENPTFGFALSGEPGGELRVAAEDNRSRRFEAAWTLGAAG